MPDYGTAFPDKESDIPDGLQCRYRPLSKQVKIDHATLQGLRATCSTRLQDAGVSQVTAAQILGHGLEVNSKHYLGLLTDQQRRAVEALPSLE